MSIRGKIVGTWEMVEVTPTSKIRFRNPVVEVGPKLRSGSCGPPVSRVDSLSSKVSRARATLACRPPSPIELAWEDRLPPKEARGHTCRYVKVTLAYPSWVGIRRRTR